MNLEKATKAELIQEVNRLQALSSETITWAHIVKTYEVVLTEFKALVHDTYQAGRATRRFHDAQLLPLLARVTR